MSENKTKTLQLPTELQLLGDMRFGPVHIVDDPPTHVSVEWWLREAYQKPPLRINLETNYVTPPAEQNIWVKQRWPQIQRHAVHITRYVNQQLRARQVTQEKLVRKRGTDEDKKKGSKSNIP